MLDQLCRDAKNFWQIFTSKCANGQNGASPRPVTPNMDEMSLGRIGAIFCHDEIRPNDSVCGTPFHQPDGTNPNQVFRFTADRIRGYTCAQPPEIAPVFQKMKAQKDA